MDVNACYRDIRRLEYKINIGRYIIEKLAVNAPWNITEAFTRGHLQYDGTGGSGVGIDGNNLLGGGTRGIGSGGRLSIGSGASGASSNLITTPLGTANLGRLDLFGIGDPSGIGEGFAYVRY